MFLRLPTTGKGKEKLFGTMHIARAECMDGGDVAISKERCLSGRSRATAHQIRELRNRRAQKVSREKPENGERMRKERSGIRPTSSANRRHVQEVSLDLEKYCSQVTNVCLCDGSQCDHHFQQVAV